MRIFGLALSATVLAACSSPALSHGFDAGGGAAIDGGGDGGVPGDAADEGGAATVTAGGLVVDLRTQAAVAGVNVCLYSPQRTPGPCVQTTASGAFHLDVPANTQLLISFELAGYVSSFAEWTTSTTPPSGAFAIIKASDEAAIATSANISVDLTKAQIAVTVADSTSLPVAGASAMAPASAGDGPYYLATTGVPDKTLTATSGEGAILWVNSTEGDVDVTVMHGATACPGSALKSWPGSTPNSVRVHLVAGYITGLAVTCP